MKRTHVGTTGLLLAAALALPIQAGEDADAPAAPAPVDDAPMDTERAHDSAWSYLQTKYDADGDDAISPAEYNRSDEAFARLDRDGDGILAEQDFGAGVRRPRGERGEQRERRERPRGTPEGEAAPDFTLRPLHLDPELELEEQLVTLSSFVDDRPVALIFGSYTWPPFRSSAGRLRELQETYGKDIQFFLVYIREAHALDSASPNTRPGAPLVEDPISVDERAIVATECAAALDLGEIEILIDDMDDTANTAYAGHPDRLYLVDDGGVVAYQGGPGPFGFSPDELEDAIRSELGLEPIEREEERPRRGRRGR